MRSNVYLRKRTTKNKETRYALVIRERGRKEVWKNLGPVSRKRAEEIRIQILNELLNGTYQREPEVSLYFEEFTEKFFADFANGARAPKTLEGYRSMLRPVLERFRGYRLAHLRRQEIESYLSSWPVSARSKNILLSILRQLFRKATEWGYLTTSPVEGIRRLRETSQGSRALTPAELQQIWNGLTACQRSIIKVLVYSGMRPGELSNLQFRDIDWQENRLLIASDDERQTKNRKSRYLPMSPDLQEELFFLKENLPVPTWNAKQDCKPRQIHQRKYIFCHEDGSRIASFRKSILRALRKQGIEGVTPHGLRKTFCSQLARSKVHPKVAQQLLGHSDVSLTMRVYTEVDDEQLKEAVQSLPRLQELRRSKLRLVS